MWQANERYPDPAVRVLDPSFNALRLPLASVERLYTGCRWSEGPVYVGDGRYLLWSDIPNNRVLRWDEESGNVTVYRKPSNNTNGHTRDRQGRLVGCEHGGRRVVRVKGAGNAQAKAFERFLDAQSHFGSERGLAVKKVRKRRAPNVQNLRRL